MGMSDDYMVCYYIGSFSKLPKTANIGDVCIVYNHEYIWTGSDEWVEIGSNGSLTPRYIYHLTHCKSCGAILKICKDLPEVKCEFCGTIYQGELE